jgi:hypothetical protein
MTPFDSWFSSTVLPQLEQTLKAVPVPAREPMRKAAREQMAACWNAALDAALGTGIMSGEVESSAIEALRARADA